jgi:hypothetical protein
MRLFEVNPHNYDSDIDYYDALRARKPQKSFDPDAEPRLTRAQQDANDEDAISQQRQQAHKKFQEKRTVKWVDKEGEAPNGHRYNKMFVVDAIDEATAAHEVYLFDKHEWGAKKIVDIRRSKSDNPDLPVRYKMYIVDNHKHGMWKPFPGEEAKGGGSPVPPVQDE